ncbi:3-carboxyethylcatechol 2,3-dioxygenase [Candidatus Poriferisodalis sp.]|uniref:DODA-type extradiol aromatic ring-opening family dioxygenase n=1 Tax=Candidatus Poriferisodalis sp. TaxID=3101277 RepID=UPI003B5CA8CF
MIDTSAVSMVCASHSPLLYCYARPPADLGALEAALAQRRDAIAEMAPDVIVAFISDHFSGFFMDVMPAFCVGTRAAAVDDIGGFPGELDVPHELALDLVAHLRHEDLDPAVSYDMRVDHAISQTLTILTGGVAETPVVPVFINCITRPFVPFRRSRLLGEAVGRFAAALDLRVLLVASGGMSHNPTRYYPAYGSSTPEVSAYQLAGQAGESTFTTDEWLERLREMHIEGAHMLVDGSRTRTDIKLNPVVDRQFLRIVTEDALDEADRWEPEAMVDKGGIGWMELHTWLAACAANRSAGGAPPVVDFYAEMLEIGIAAGVIHAG